MITNLMITLLSAIPSAEPSADMFGWLLEMGHWIVAQFQAKNFMPAIGGLVMLIVWAVKKYMGDKLQTEKLALLAAGLGVALAMATEAVSMAAGMSGFDIFRALANGFMVGASASGFWSLLGKKILPPAA